MTRYQNFPPEDTTTLVVPRVVEMHAGDASFLWGIRRKAVRSQKYRLRDLARADERVEAHLEGIEVAGADGWAMLVDDLEIGVPGAIFAGSVWCMRMGDEGRFGAILDSAQEDRARLDAVVSGLGWSGLSEAWARRLLTESSAPSRYVAVGACAVCRAGPTRDEVDAMLVKETHAPTLARAARMVGELGMGDAVTPLEYLLSHQAPEVRQAAAWSVAIVQPRNRDYLPILVAAAQDEKPNADLLDMAGRKLPIDQVQVWTRELLEAGRVRPALIVSAACGLPALIDDILPLLAQPEVARLAGFAFSQITGADLVKLNLELDSKPEAGPAKPIEGDLESSDGEEPVSQDEEEDSHLPVPDPALITAWWREHQAELSPTARYLAGRPMTDPGLRQTLIEGTQPQRRAAAVELALLRRGPLYNTSQPGFVQARDLLGWT